ncbi:MAG: DUF839 domain-containing protein [Planctomycetota bacterium]|nr:DUF839 domain-containing protein [Planctomycetota bacterium]
MDQRSDGVRLDRREVLAWLSASAAWIAAGGCAATKSGNTTRFVLADGSPSWTPVPLPLPIGSDGGDAATDATRLASFVVRDELVVPEGFEVELLASWGERFGPKGAQIVFGHNNDFLGFIPDGPDAAWLVVNHEYIAARPWLQGYEEARGEPLRFRIAPLADGNVRFEFGEHAVEGKSIAVGEAGAPADVAAAARELSRRALEDLGISILRLERTAGGGWRVDRDSPLHKRISGTDPRTPTHSNCSGTVTPWGTALSGEENYQDYVQEAVDASGEPSPNRLLFSVDGVDERFPEPVEFLGIGAAIGQDGRDFGWVCHVDPRSGALEKLANLGRMRHENVALRVEAGKPLVAYTGDDRRGGHVWKFISARKVERVDDPANVRLFDEGTLHVERFAADGTGEWIPLVPSTRLVRPAPERTGGGHLWLPDRSKLRDNGIAAGGWIAVSTPEAKKQGLSAAEWCASVASLCGKPFEQLTLGDLVCAPSNVRLDEAGLARHLQRVLLLDAVVMANAIGATPCARPEDLELHPHDSSVFVSFSDFTSLSSEGSPDAGVFPDSRAATSKRYGAIYRLEEELDGASLRFRWSSFCQSGELSDGGAGFANPDNLCFDPAGNLWVLTDISSASQNADVARDGESAPGRDRFAGVFGSSALFMIPTRGPRAGIAHCFATGPVECELCGVTFSSDGETLFLAVQHPGEQHGTRGHARSGLPTEVERRVLVAARDGKPFEQIRSVPLGSNWPSGKLGVAPRPSVVAIRRR